MEIVRLLDVNDKEIGRVILDNGKLTLEGAAEDLRGLYVADICDIAQDAEETGEVVGVTGEQPERWFKNLEQLGHPPYFKVVRD